MPLALMYFNTNLQDKDVADDFERRLCEKVGEVLNKPIERMTLTIRTGLRQMRAGSKDPMVSLDIYSIDVFSEEKNPTYTTPLFNFLKEEFKLPNSRVLLVYHDLKKYNVGQDLS